MRRQDSTHPTGVSTDEGRDQRGGTGRSTVSAARARKANAAVQLRLAGATWEEIALALGYPTPRQALVATEKALEKQLDSDVDREKMRKLAGQRLERLLRSVWGKAVDENHPDHLLAATKAREIIDRHAKLFGLDAPTEVVVHSPTQQELESWVLKVVNLGAPSAEPYDIFGEVVEAEIVPEIEGKAV